ncbi:hypothetical protein HK101_003969 [Irineochytrium annulatum]|nr:hypothetical protein HK101_003969 [Irineochytrium annulatum]
MSPIQPTTSSSLLLTPSEEPVMLSLPIDGPHTAPLAATAAISELDALLFGLGGSTMSLPPILTLQPPQDPFSLGLHLQSSHSQLAQHQQQQQQQHDLLMMMLSAPQFMAVPPQQQHQQPLHLNAIHQQQNALVVPSSPIHLPPSPSPSASPVTPIVDTATGDAAKPRRQRRQGHHPCPFPSCARHFTRRYNLTAHIRGAHTHERPFACQTCGAGFARAHDLSRHRRCLHPGEFKSGSKSKVGGVKEEDGDDDAARLETAKKYKCEGCGMDFARSDALKKHRELEIRRMSRVAGSGKKTTSETVKVEV